MARKFLQTDAFSVIVEARECEKSRDIVNSYLLIEHIDELKTFLHLIFIF